MTSADAPAGASFDLDRAWDLHPQVSVRPEPFGALLYHFGTRKLTFLKDLRLLSAVQGLTAASCARAACSAAGVGDTELPYFRAALARLARSAMVVERKPDERSHTS
ncbi:mycofactocin biosynthesis chaperone MftB [Streptomyces sp. NPDC007264]|uniref:mycofactocin biosynthesis chaperone MftB n=1 Tax=Streptomyces sp. NPDC007264 TaxID=3364777 RepID=UPI0036D8110A